MHLKAASELVNDISLELQLLLCGGQLAAAHLNLALSLLLIHQPLLGQVVKLASQLTACPAILQKKDPSCAVIQEWQCTQLQLTLQVCMLLRLSDQVQKTRPQLGAVMNSVCPLYVASDSSLLLEYTQFCTRAVRCKLLLARPVCQVCSTSACYLQQR